MASDTPEAITYQQAIMRWKQGHHVFHLLLVTINTLLDDCLVQVHNRNWSELICPLHLLRVLFDSATSSMVYTADFPEQYYTTLIRPSMSFPFLSPGFSGQLNREHDIMHMKMRKLAQGLTSVLGSQRESWPSPLVGAWKELGVAQAYNRRNHALICQKFVPNGGSLLQLFYKDHESIV